MRKEVLFVVLFFSLIFSLAIVSAVPYDFGGAYGTDYWNNNCRYPNPATTNCSCPTGYTPQQTWGGGIVDEFSGDNKVFYCYRNHTAGVNGYYDFGGMYGQGHGTSYWTNCARIDINNPTVNYTNPINENKMGCPLGYTSSQITGYASSGIYYWDYKSYFCYKTGTGNSAAEFGGLVGWALVGRPYRHPETKNANCPINYTRSIILASASGYCIVGGHHDDRGDNTLSFCYKNITIVPPEPPTPTETHFCSNSSQIIMKLYQRNNSHVESALFLSSPRCVGTPAVCLTRGWGSNCDTNPGCFSNYTPILPTWPSGRCDGTAVLCSNHSNQNECNADRGCNWEIPLLYNYQICYNEIFGSSYTGANPHSCTETNKVLGLSAITNANAQIPSLTDYTPHVCYDNLQCQKINSGECSSLGNDYKCVITISEDTNAHVTACNLTKSTIPIEDSERTLNFYAFASSEPGMKKIYGCTSGTKSAWTESSSCSDVSGYSGAHEVFSVLSTQISGTVPLYRCYNTYTSKYVETTTATICDNANATKTILGYVYLNAHSEVLSYNKKICCKPQASIAPGDVYWANMNQAPLIAPNNRAQINDSVLLVWNNSGLSDGTQVTFSIKEKDMLLNDKIRDVTGIVKNGKATAKWKITNADYSLGKDLIGSSEFIFTVQGKTSGELIIEETISNTRPTIEIISPIDESIHLKGAQINFNQLSSDPDDELVVTWGFGDSLSERKIGNCQFPGNCNTNHSYNLAGTKIVSATASETDRGQSATDRIRIAIYEDGLNLIPIISSPDPRTITAFSGRNVFFNGSESYVANCTSHRNDCNLALAPSGKTELTQANCYDVSGTVNSQPVTLHCFDYPKSWIVDSPKGYELWFNWTFMQANQYYGNILGNWGSNYNEAIEFNKFFVGNSNLLREVNLKIGFDYHN